MDDFGDFLQAPPVVGTNAMKPTTSSERKQPMDLNSKILSSFDLSGSSQKATFKFQQPSRHTGKRPQGSHFKQSSSSADWKNINLENEFMSPIVPRQQTFAPQTKQRPGNILPPGQNHALNADLMGLSLGNSSAPITPNVSMPQTVQSYQHYVQNQPVGLTKDWQHNPEQPIARAGNQLLGPPTNSNPDYRGGDILPPHHGSNMIMNQSHPTKVSGSGTGAFYGGSFAQSREGIIHPQNSQPPINLFAGQKMPSIETRGPQSTSNGSSLPSWMTDPNQIPPVYKQVLKITATNNSFADTNLLYPIFLSSELPKDILGHIWTVANQSTPGKLTYTEVYTALALIALAQKGEMDLSTRYVMKLQTAPIPKIQLSRDNSPGLGQPMMNATPKYKANDASSKTIGSFSQIPEFNTMQNSQSSDADGFADFQSFTISLPSTQNLALSTSFNNEFNMSSLPSSCSMPVETKPVTMQYPDRDLINSPKHMLRTDTYSHDSPKQLLETIDFNKFNDESSSKVLHSAAKKLNVSHRPVPPIPAMEDDFDDFKCAKSFPSTMKATSSGNDLQPNSGLAFMQLNTTTETNDKFAVLRTVDSVTQQTNGVKLDGSMPLDSNDKYAVFREIGLVKDAEQPEHDFADFQSVESQEVPATQPIQLLNIRSNITPLSDVKKAPISEDILSISSLELPSLSRTILNNSIGTTTTTSESLNSFGLPNEGTLHFAPSVPNVSGKSTSLDDGLYDLDEPISISPVYPRKQVIVSGPTKPEPPKIDSSSVIRAKISNLSDSDFADFSSGPPPIDDDIDQHDTEIGLDEGDSSLVDFDAFGHFEEAKMEVQKKKESAFKRTREDATAFSEFVKSSVVDLKPAHPHESCTTLKQDTTLQFNGEDSSVTENECYQTDDSTDTLSISVTGNSNADEGSSVVRGWKLEPSRPEVQSNSSMTIEASEWEKEGNELKARMEGSSNPMEIFTDHWSRCLATCKDIIVSTGDIFASLNSPSVCHEVVNSSRGKEFISCTSEVYGVSRRIRKGMETVGLEDEDLMSSLKEIEIAWNNLLGFCPYTPSVHKTPEHRVCANKEKSSSACSLCLLDTESTEVSGLEYCGRFYHAPCANLWLNQIAPILPRLEVPAN